MFFLCIRSAACPAILNWGGGGGVITNEMFKLIVVVNGNTKHTKKGIYRTMGGDITPNLSLSTALQTLHELYYNRYKKTKTAKQWNKIHKNDCDRIDGQKRGR